MPTDPIKLYNFWQQYLWLDTDFSTFQAQMYASIESARESFGIITGLQIVPNPSGMTVTVKAGVAVNSAGKLLVLASDTTVTVATPAGNPAKSYIILRPVETQVTNIPKPTDPLTTVQLYTQRSATLMALDGTPAGSPSYPSLSSGDLVLMGLTLTSGQTTLPATSWDLVKRQSWQSKEMQITKVSANYQALITDRIIEVDASGGAVSVTIPTISLLCGRQQTVRKIDSSANAVTIVGAIDGATNPTLVDQYDYMTYYSNGATLGQM